MIYIGVYKYKINYDFFKQQDEHFWYIAGFIAADGYISDERIEICINKKDEELLIKIKNLISPDKPIYDVKKTKSKKFTINSIKLAAFYKNIFSLKTNNKGKEIRLPVIPNDMLRHFVRGVIDGDGCIDLIKAYRDFPNYKKVYYGPRIRILGNYYFLKELNQAIKEHIPHKVNAITKKGKENVYCVAYTFKFAEMLIEWIYYNSKIHLKRKYKKSKEVIEGKHEDVFYSLSKYSES